MKVRVQALYRIPQDITAAWAVAFRIAVQFYYAFSGEEDTVARGAHLAGFAAGAVLVLVLRCPGVPLFDRTVSKV